MLINSGLAKAFLLEDLEWSKSISIIFLKSLLRTLLRINLPLSLFRVVIKPLFCDLSNLLVDENDDFVILVLCYGLIIDDLLADLSVSILFKRLLQDSLAS